ncbi:Fc.00g039100.m01.CDS01 [Cosmosporella sp. VM-42]
MTTPSAAVIGSTGLVGSNILTTLLASDTYTPIHTITRRAPKPTSTRLNSIVEADNTKWTSLLSGISPVPATVFSALGTTRAQAGGLANQWKIDHDLNIELARAAKEAGSRTFVFISSAGTRSFLSSLAPYSKMKNGVEDAIKELEFEHAVILKPAMILGEREGSRATEGLIQGVVKALNHVGMQDRLGQEAEVIARAAVRAAQLVEEGKAPSKYWVIDSTELIKLGRTEWKESKVPETAQ